MMSRVSDTGSFVISLDTELGWGTFDVEGFGPDDYDGTRGVIRRLVELFDEHEVPATWAVVTHILRDCRTNRDVHPDSDQTGWYDTLPCRTGMDEESWYEPELIDWIRNTSVDHDIGSHTHTHLVAPEHDAKTVSRDLKRSVSVIEDGEKRVRSFVFPRNRIAHRDRIRDAGIEVIRGRDARWFESPTVPKALSRVARLVEEAAKLTPPTVIPRERAGLVELPGSQVFRPDHGGWEYTPNESQLDRAIAGLNRAAETGEIFHLWFHPFNLVRDPDFLLELLNGVLGHADTLRDSGRLDIQTMAAVAEDYRNGRWVSLE
ncbi:hypothetical protein EXE43_07715 [Halorubrum sp. SS5]|nr:hypothetical protein EXE43_07715 [Halorubrum sp. SS5]